tara:strand:- start:3889 stop:4683 length:795 start_codon:yes stop_codon:yes gene_type:complete
MKLGFIQNKPIFGEVDRNLDRIESLLSGEKADLAVLPELFAVGYQFVDTAEAREFAEPIPCGPTTQRIIRWAKEMNGVIVAGLVELEGSMIYNSAVIVNSEGVIGSYRKVHLFDVEKKVFSPGNGPLQVFDIGIARLGVMICFDWRFPEICRTLAVKGADIIAHPSNLILPHCPQSMITRCLENRVFAVTADRVGEENRINGERLKFIGQSQLVDPDGNLLHRASKEEEKAWFTEIDQNQARQKSINSVNNLFADRRTDLYELN